ncbi:MAG TPA: glycosyltransferase family 39 protein [Streptosporangiaceae bacterium]|nr:glycosyltransferase family 39 protein [Streptosporangiaceae bacterium]
MTSLPLPRAIAPAGHAAEAAAAERAPVRWIALIAAAAVALEMAVSARYGYHRDELYFLAAGQHPAFGYVDQPPLTPLAARLSALASGNSLIALRLIPALTFAALVALTAAMSRQLGAGRTGQVLAALATATCAEFLAAMHLLTTTTPDFLFWAITMLLAVRLLASSNPRWWLAIGACAGVAAEAKWNIAFLVAALAAGFAATPARRLAASWWLAGGAALAAALAAPDLIWQAAHGWPAFDVFAALQGDAGHNRLVYWIAQVIYTGVALTPVWLGGLAWLFRDPAGRRWRPLAIASVVVICIFFVLGGKSYYPGGIYTFLFAAGSVPLGRRLAVRPRRHGLRPGVLTGVVMIAASLLSLPVAVPVLPASTLRAVPLQQINYDLAETIGWQRQVGLVARVYRGLPPAARARTTILTGNYGEAGALARFGPADGLPAAYSGANNFWYWGPPPARDTSAIAVNVSPALLHRTFTAVRRVATFENGPGVSDDEEGVAVYVATGLRTPWRQAWSAFRDFS